MRHDNGSLDTRCARPKTETLIIAMASAAIILAAMPSYIIQMDAYPYCSTPAVRDWISLEIVATAAVVGVGIHVTILIVLALLPRMTTRRWMVAIAMVAIVLTVRIYLWNLAHQYRALAKYHESQHFALARGRHWSGSLDESRYISIGSFGYGSVGDAVLKGRDLAIVLWHIKLSEKYQYAALHPWIPIPPDPPKPD